MQSKFDLEWIESQLSDKMSTVYTPGFTFGPPQDQKDPYRYYQCELRWNSWTCKQTETKEYNAPIDPNVLATKLVTVNKMIPKCLDSVVVQFKVNSIVKIKDEH